jgi:hypothetical protein
VAVTAGGGAISGAAFDGVLLPFAHAVSRMQRSSSTFMFFISFFLFRCVQPYLAEISPKGSEMVEIDG